MNAPAAKIIMAVLLMSVCFSSLQGQSLPDVGYVNGVRLADIQAPYLILTPAAWGGYMTLVEYGNPANDTTIWNKYVNRKIPASVLTDSTQKPVRTGVYSRPQDVAVLLTFMHRQGWAYHSRLESFQNTPNHFIFQKI